MAAVTQVPRGWTPEAMAERLAADIPDGSYVNLGIGLPELVAITVDIDQNAERDQEQAKEKADQKSGCEQIVEKLFPGDMENHALFLCNVCARGENRSFSP